jgi:hypothetical protein
MTALHRLIPNPQLLEIDSVDVAAPASRVWDIVRDGDLASSTPIRALFRLRVLASRDAQSTPLALRIDGMRSSPERPGFQILADDPPNEVAVGAIGKVWKLDIPFVHVADDLAYSQFSEPGFVKVAWAIRVVPRGPQSSHVELEVRVAATDVASWRKFRRYFRVIGPFSRFIRRSTLRALARNAASPEVTRDGARAA